MWIITDQCIEGSSNEEQGDDQNTISLPGKRKGLRLIAKRIVNQRPSVTSSSSSDEQEEPEIAADATRQVRDQLQAEPNTSSTGRGIRTKLTCDICDKKFQSKSAIAQHMNSHVHDWHS